MRTWALVTGRMTSARLPGKTMADIHGMPSLARICDRLAAATALDGVVVATSDDRRDDPIRNWADDAGLPCHAGSLEDVLSRTLDAARLVEAERLVFVNGDSPLTDPRIADAAIARHDAGDADYVSSLHGGGGYPDGYSVEVFLLDALARIASGEVTDAMREHVTIPFYARGSLFRVATLAPHRPPPAPLHLSLDTAEDLELLRDIFAKLLPVDPHFGYADVMALLRGDEALLQRALART